MSRKYTLKNAIIQSFDRENYKSWGLVCMLSSASMKTITHKALDVMNNPYTTKAVTKKTKSVVKKLWVG